MSAIFVLHAPGAADGGARWSEALLHAGWDGPIVAPDLPGHRLTPAPPGGHYDLAQPAFDAHRILLDAGLKNERPIVVGVGAYGWPGQLLALGGRTSGLVLVDGLGGPWRSPPDMVAFGRDHLRTLADDTAALAPHTSPGLDPRLAHGPRPHGSRDLALRAARAVAVPTLVIESPQSSLSSQERDELLAVWSAAVAIREVPDPSPDVVSELVLAWVSRLSPTPRVSGQADT